MNTNRSVTATFLRLRTLSVTVAGTGSVSLSPGGGTCASGTCAFTFLDNTTVSLFPSPGTSFAFGRWSGDCTGSGGCDVIMSQDRAVTAAFDPLLTVTRTGPGTVTSMPTGIACGPTCENPFPLGGTVTLTATPDAGYVFWGWLGDCSGTGACNLTMDGPHFVSAWFGDNVPTQLLYVSLPGAGLIAPGEIYSNPPGISCLNDSFHGPFGCFGFFPQNSIVTLTAFPLLSSHYFTGWGGDCAGAGINYSCTVTMDVDRIVSGAFAQIPTHTMYVSLPGAGLLAPGGIYSSPPGIECFNDSFHGNIGCFAAFYEFDSYRNPTFVTLTAGPTSGYFFVGWTGDCAGSGTNPTCTLLIDADHFVGGSFAKQSKLVLNVHKNPNFSPGGSVFADNPGETCTAERQCIYTYNIIGITTVTLTAIPDDGATWRWRIYCEPAGSDPTCAFDIGNGLTQTVDIYFMPHVVLNVGGQGAGGGWVEVSPTGRACYAVPPPGGNTCVYSFPGGTFITFTPHPDEGYTFDWGQFCEGSGTTCSFNAWPGETWTADINFFL